MSRKPIKTLDMRTRLEWRKWLEQHCDSEAGIWLVFDKRHTDVVRQIAAGKKLGLK